MRRGRWPGRGSRRYPTTTSVPRSAPALGLAEHGVGLADARRGAEVDRQPAPPPSSPRRPEVILAASQHGEVEQQHVDPWLAQHPRGAALGVLGDQVARRRLLEAAARRAPVAPGASAYARRDVRVEAGARRGDGVGRHAAGRRPRAAATSARRSAIGCDQLGALGPRLEPSVASGSKPSRPPTARVEQPGSSTGWPISAEPDGVAGVGGVRAGRGDERAVRLPREARPAATPVTRAGRRARARRWHEQHPQPGQDWRKRATRSFMRSSGVPGTRETTRSRSLMPTNGAISPPSP